MAAASEGVWLQLVGAFAVYRGGRRLPAAAVGSRKARVLLSLLGVHSGRLVPVKRITDVVWTQAPRLPAPSVATLVSRLRATLGPGIVVGGRDGYRLGETTQVDLDVAAMLVEAAEDALTGRDPDRALLTAQQALVLLDDVLALDDVVWAEPAAVRHTDLLGRARHYVAEAALQTGHPQIAIAGATAATRADAYDETAQRHLMRAHHMAGDHARALTTYQRLRTTLIEELGVEPAGPTRDLYLAILRDNHPGTR